MPFQFQTQNGNVLLPVLPVGVGEIATLPWLFPILMADLLPSGPALVAEPSQSLTIPPRYLLGLSPSCHSPGISRWGRVGVSWVFEVEFPGDSPPRARWSTKHWAVVLHRCFCVCTV